MCGHVVEWNPHRRRHGPRRRVHGRVLPMDNAKDYRLNNVNGFLAYGRHLWSNGAQAPSATADRS